MNMTTEEKIIKELLGDVDVRFWAKIEEERQIYYDRKNIHTEADIEINGV